MYRNSKIKICGKQLCKINGKVDSVAFHKELCNMINKKEIRAVIEKKF
jgi:hypothetical protein